MIKIRILSFVFIQLKKKKTMRRSAMANEKLYDIYIFPKEYNSTFTISIDLHICLH